MMLLVSSMLLLLAAVPSLEAATKETLIVSTIEAEGFSMQHPNGQWFGLVPDLVREIGKELNFEPNFSKVGDGRYGAFEESTGQWNGMIGEVASGKVAFAAAPLTATFDREQHVDFSQEFLDTGLSMIIKRPEWSNPVARSAAFFLSVFDAGVWCSVILVFGLTSFLVFINDRYNPRELKARQAEHNSRSATAGHNLLAQMNDFSLFGSLFYVVSTGCFQGYRRAPQSLVGRSLSVFWWLFSCLFAAAYVAGFLCALVASRGDMERQFPLRDVRGAYQYDSTSFKGFVPLWLANGSTNAFFEKSTEPVFQMFYRQYLDGVKAEPELAKLSSIKSLLDKIRTDGRYFAVVESVLADFYSRATSCEVLMVGNLLNDRSYAFAFPEGSNLTRQVNEVLLRLRESGFVRKIYREHFLHDTTHCGSSPNQETITMSLAGEEMARMFRNSLPLTLYSFSGPVLFYVISLLFSGLAALADIYIYTRYERYRQGNQPFQSTPEQPEQPEQDASFGTLTFSDDQRLAPRDQEA